MVVEVLVWEVCRGGVGHGEISVSDVVVVGAGAGGRVSWGVSVEVGIGGGRVGLG